VRTRRRCASRVFRWHRPASSAGPAPGSPCGTACAPTPKGGLDVAQAFPVSQLRKGHHPIMFGTRKSSHPAVAVVTVDDTGECSAVGWVRRYSAVTQRISRPAELGFRYASTHSIMSS
jgi:hypothetical protein